MKGTVLVTGGAGYVGAHLNKYLNQRRYKTVVLDSLERGHKEFVKWGTFIEGEVGDRSLLNQLFADFDIDSVIHLAAYAYVGESVSQPIRYWKNNVSETLTLLESCVEFDIRKIILSSTCATYGQPQKLPITEDHPQKPINPYGSTKLAIELMLKDLSAAHGMKYFILRYFNAAGADPNGEIGERHKPETHLIPIILEAILNEEKTVPGYGVDYETADGTCVRDYVHVMDLADAHFRALQYLERGGDNQECNLGLGQGFSVNEVIQSAERVTGCKIVGCKAPKRAGDPPVLIADSMAVRRILGWKPQFTSLDSIIKTAWDWHRSEKKATRQQY